MSRNKLNLVLDVVGYLLMVCLTATGVLLWKVLPPGTGGRHGGGRGVLTILGRSRHEWGDVHFYLALGLIAIVVLHLVLHWRWITNSLGALVRSKASRKAGAGAGGAILLLALGIVGAGVVAAPWLIPVNDEAGGGRGGKGRGAAADCATCGQAEACIGEKALDQALDNLDEGTIPDDAAAGTHEHHGGHGRDRIRGRTTVAEAAKAAGVTVERLLAELKLPATTPATASFGPLRQQHGLEMEGIRATVDRLKKEAAPK